MISTHHKVVYYSDKTNCEYDSLADASREELRAELTDEIMADGAMNVSIADVQDVLDFMLKKFPILYMPKGEAQ